MDTTKATLTYSATLELMEIQPDGSYTLVPMDSAGYSGADWDTPVKQFDVTFIARATPDGQGSALYASQNVTRSIFSNKGTSTFEAMIYRDTGGSFPNPVGLGGFGGDQILVGENNTGFVSAFDNTGGKVAAFDLTTGQPKYFYQSSQNVVRLNTVASDGSVFIEEGNFAGTNYLTKLDPAGDPSPVFPGNPTRYNWSYWTLGHWGASQLGNFVLPVADNVLVAASEWPQGDGNGGTQQASPTPIVLDYLPSNIDTGLPGSTPDVTTTTYPCAMDSFISNVAAPDGSRCTPPTPTRKVDQRYVLREHAIVQNFKSDLKEKVNALAFIGHSAIVHLGQPNEFSIGIQFFYPTLGTTPGDLATWDTQYSTLLPDGSTYTQYLAPECYPYSPLCGQEGGPMPANKLLPFEKDAASVKNLSSAWNYQNDLVTTAIFPGPDHRKRLLVGIEKEAAQARILFFAACSLQPSFAQPKELPVFLQMWDVHDAQIDYAETRDRALVVPITNEVDLGSAAGAWRQILWALVVRRMTIDDAVNFANGQPGQKVQFRVLGNHNVKLVNQ